MTRTPASRLTRALGVGLLSAALGIGAAGTATAAPSLPDPVASTPRTAAPSIEEQLAALGPDAVANRWFVESTAPPRWRAATPAAPSKTRA